MRRLPLVWLASIPLSCARSEAEPEAVAVGLRAGNVASADAALVLLHDSLPVALAAAKLKSDVQAALVDAMAWGGEDPFALQIRRGPRGQVHGVSARLLAYDGTPALPKAPTQARAKALVDDGGLVRALLGLSEGDALELRGQMPLQGGEVRFDFAQSFDGTPVHDASAHLVLDTKGRLRRVDATTVPTLDPSLVVTVAEADAIATAIDDLQGKGDPLWMNAPIEARKTELVLLDQTPIDGTTRERMAWRVELAAEAPAMAGDREVLVDAESGAVLSSVERARLALDGNDHIAIATGAIGMGLDIGDELRWTGLSGCTPPPVLPGDSPALGRDLDEVVAALCEADEMLIGLTGQDAQFWFDRGAGIRFGVGAIPGISIGINTVDGIAFAEGAARAEVVGHELWHSVMGGPRTAFTRGIPEGAAIEEHMVDVFGILLERRLDRREDDCLISDDPDTMAAIAGQSFTPGETTHRPCALTGEPRAWRSSCEPTDDNGGWCEGAVRYGDMVAGPFDAYGTPPELLYPSTDHHVASHTNLGIGNRMVMSLLGEPTTPALGAGFGDDTVARLLVDASLRMPPSSQWANWADAWIEAAAALEPGAAPGPIEHRVRQMAEASMLWTTPTEVLPTLGGVTAPRVPARIDARPAAASVVVPGGAELTYVFYRDASDALRYVRRREPDGGTMAGPTTTVGPCTVPGVTTHHDPAAVGRDDGGLFVAFNDTAVAGTPGHLQLRTLLSPASGDTCDDVWMPLEPAAPRELVGAPTLASWTASADRTICDIIASDLPGLPFPFVTSGAIGLQIGDCVDVIERIPPFDIRWFDPWLGEDLFGLLGQPLDAWPGLRGPSPIDPWNPGLRAGEVVDRIALGSLFTKPDATTNALGKLPKLGHQLQRALDPKRGADAITAELQLQWQGVTLGNGLPQGDLETVDLRIVDERLVVGFRDPSDRLRVVQVTDPRETDGDDPIPVLATSFDGDPVLATASARYREWGEPTVEVEYLYAFYVHADPEDPALHSRLSYRVATLLPHDADPGDPAAFTAELFAAPERLDTITDVEGVRRQVSYAYARTKRTPVVVGEVNRLNLFTVALAHGAGAPDPALDTEVRASRNRVRWASLAVAPGGALSWDSERPVILPETAAAHSSHDTAVTTAGAAVRSHGRERVEWYYPMDLDDHGPRLQRRARR